jgi:aspartyl-tRNA(Asn)/glutamyl-tRNA(Gln) amidotransferase subunit A
VPAPVAGQSHVVLRGGQKLTVRDALIRYTAPFNVTGWPALSLPLGLGRDGLPRGLQLVGRMYDEARLLDIGEELLRRLPPLPLPQD